MQALVLCIEAGATNCSEQGSRRYNEPDRQKTHLRQVSSEVASVRLFRTSVLSNIFLLLLLYVIVVHMIPCTLGLFLNEIGSSAYLLKRDNGVFEIHPALCMYQELFWGVFTKGCL